MHRPNISPQATTSGTVRNVSGSGNTAVKALLGCGCLMIVLAGLAGVSVIGGGAFWLKKQADENPELVQELKGLGKEIKEAQKNAERAGKGAVTGKGDPTKTAASFNPDNYLEWMSGPIDVEGLRQHIKFKAMWEATPEVKNMKQGMGTLNKLDEAASAAEKLRAARAGMKLQSGSIQALHSLEERAKPFGGQEKVFQRALRAGLLATSAHELAKANKLDASSNAVAALMKKGHVDAQKKFQAWQKAQIAFFSKNQADLAAKNQDPEAQKRIIALAQDMSTHNNWAQRHPGEWALGRADAQGVQAWSELDAGTRKKLLDEAFGLPTLPMLLMSPFQKRDGFQHYMLTMETQRLIKKHKPATP